MPNLNSTAARCGFIETAPANLPEWLAAIEARAVPVLAHTAATLEQLRAIEDDVDAHSLADELGQDPLFVLKLLRHVAWLTRDKANTSIETTTEALVMLGTGPFFRAFGPQPAAEQQLQALPEVVAGFEAVLQRSHRAARLALAFAVHRQDTDAMVIYQAALLHDFVELLLWLHAPGLALAIERLHREQPECSTELAQLSILNVSVSNLQQVLMKTWRLPRLLIDISDDVPSDRHQVRNVQLAIRVARHSAQGWNEPKLDDDVSDVALLLGMARGPCLALLQDIDR